MPTPGIVTGMVCRLVAKEVPPARRGRAGGFRWCPATGRRVTALVRRLRGCLVCITHRHHPTAMVRRSVRLRMSNA
jgi:hypothetical protein